MAVVRRILKRLGVALLVCALVFAGLLGYLVATNPKPHASKGWDRLGDLPNPRGEGAAAVGARVDDCGVSPDCPTPVRFFVIGGLSGAGRTVATVNAYDPEATMWRRAPSLPEPRHHPAAAGGGGVVYVTGGGKSAINWKPERQTWSLAPDGTAWTSLPDMPEGRLGHQMILTNRTLYVFGGRGATSAVLIFDIQAGTWRAGAAMPQQRDHVAAVLAGGKIYAIGGRQKHIESRVDIYDIATDSWSDGPRLPVPMSGMAAGLLTDGIHVVGGEDPATIGGDVLNRHYRLNPTTNAWEEASLPILATHGSAAAVLDDRLVIAGGARRQGALSPLAWTGVMQSYGVPAG